MKYNLNQLAPIAIFCGVFLIFNKKKNDVMQAYVGYTLMIFGLIWLIYSSKALLLLMYQKFIQEEVNIQIQQQSKQNFKNQSKKKQQIKNENYMKISAQQKEQSVRSTTKEVETQSFKKEEQELLENKQENQKSNKQKQTQKKQDSGIEQKIKNDKNEIKKENKQKKVEQQVVQQENDDNNNDDEWVEVGNKKKQLNHIQKKEEEVQLQAKSIQQLQKNQKINEQQLKQQIELQSKQQNLVQKESLESIKIQNKKEKEKKQKQKQKIEEQQVQDEDEEEWISVQGKQTKIKDKTNINDEVDTINNIKQQSRGLFTKEEYQKLKEEAKQIEEAYRMRIQQIDDIHHCNSISKLTQYEIKNADKILNNQNITTIPKIDLKILDVKPKSYTREEIDKLVQDKMPKPKNVISNDVFIEKSDPIKCQTKNKQEGDKQVLKSKLIIFKQNQQEQKQQNEQLIYTDPPITFMVNKNKQQSFFSEQIEQTTNTKGKELFGRVKRYRRPIQKKNISEMKQNQNNIDNDNFEPQELDQNKVLLPRYQELDEQDRIKLIRDTIPVIYREDLDDENILEEETMSLVLAGRKEIIHQEYIQLLNKFRDERRKILEQKKYDQYIDLIEQMDEEIYQLTEDGINIIIQSLNISQEDYEKSFLFYSQKQEFVSQLVFFQQNLKDILPAKFKLNKLQGIQLIKYKINVIENRDKNEQFSTVIKVFNNRQSNDNSAILPILLNSLIDDIIYQKFGYEEEDKIRFMKLFDKDQEVRQLQLQLDHLVENLYVQKIN
ncbi:unnamed protein product [Paramecium sonneborni]|uniref:Transmembrane protein n=1 Tax=Paramecium sonneborni TaxID=65129 RepID=A0A8S1KFV9_9CILI|nr:unnamed protein product [Paramecium sonneborni]